MKQLKFLAFLIMGILGCLGMTSCGNDDDEPSDGSSIVGIWEGRFCDEGDWYNLSYEFKKDGTFSGSAVYDDSYTGKFYGTYSLAGDPSEGCKCFLRTFYDDDPYDQEDTVFVHVQGNKLTIKWIGDDVQYVLTRK